MSSIATASKAGAVGRVSPVQDGSIPARNLLLADRSEADFEGKSV